MYRSGIPKRNLWIDIEVPRWIMYLVIIMATLLSFELFGMLILSIVCFPA